MNRSFFVFSNGSNSSLEQKLNLLENKVNNMKLMYRRPGSENYENITQVLDNIFDKLETIEERLNNKEN